MKIQVIKNIKNKKDGYTVNLATQPKQTLIKAFICIGQNLPMTKGSEFILKQGSWTKNEKGLVLKIESWEKIPRALIQDPLLVQQAIFDILNDQEANGISCSPILSLYEKIDRYFEFKNEFAQEKLITRVMMELLSKKEISLEKDMLYRTEILTKEKALTRDIIRLQLFKKDCLDPKEVETEIIAESDRTGVLLAREQKNGCIRALSNQVSIITGGAGTGKTTIIRFITNIYLNHFPDKKIRLLSPTGKAALELNKGIDKMRKTQESAKTIHGHLGLIPQKDGGCKRVKDTIINEDFLIVDEFSMVDLALAQYLFQVVKNGVKVLILGDANQLESIGFGNVFFDLIESHVIPVTHLNRVYRQEDGSLIKINGERINRGVEELEYGDHFQLIQSSDFKNSADQLIHVYLELLKTESIKDIMILSPYRQYTESSVNALNKRIRNLLNPNQDEKNKIIITGKEYREGDRIIFMKNGKQVRNGEIGTLKEINQHEVIFKLDKNSRILHLGHHDPDLILDHSYAITVHKSQGSEYNFCLFTLIEEHKHITRNLLYTAVTRAKEKMIIVGEESAIRRAICLKKENRESSLISRLNELDQQMKGGKNEHPRTI